MSNVNYTFFDEPEYLSPNPGGFKMSPEIENEIEIENDQFQIDKKTLNKIRSKFSVDRPKRKRRKYRKSRYQ